MQGIRKDKVRKAKKVLFVDLKDGPGEEDEPGDVIQRGMQARPCAFMYSKPLLQDCTLQSPQENTGGVLAKDILHIFYQRIPEMWTGVFIELMACHA